VKNLLRIACVLMTGLLGACGGGSSEAEGSAGDPPAQDSRLVLDTAAWDQGNWAD